MQRFSWLARRSVLAAAGALLLGAGSASAQDEFEVSRYGGRIGFSSDPDQFTLGAFAALGELAPHLIMRPSVDLGFGDDVISLILNADLQYMFVLDTTVTPFLGAGLGLAYYSFDLPEGAEGDEDDTAVGLNLYGGGEMDMGNDMSAYGELRVGIDDLPDFKVTFGIGFY